MKFLLIISFACAVLICCSFNVQNSWSSNTNSNDTTVRLGKSRYYITIPKDFEVWAGPGKDGTLSCAIGPINDDSLELSGHITLRKGIYYAEVAIYDPKEYVPGYFFGKKTNWLVGHAENASYYYARTSVKGITAEAGAKDRKGIDKIIAILATVRKR